MNKNSKAEVRGLPTVDELRATLQSNDGSAARDRLSLLFDAKTFVELNAYAKRGFSDFLTTDAANEFEGVITGYGAVDGKLVFAFAQDSTRMGGVIDERHAKKICDLYKLAISNGAPVIGIFDSCGTDVFLGTSGIAAYGKIMSAVAEASGTIPQIAYVSGNCIGTAAAIAAMFDFVIKEDAASFYVSAPHISGVENAQSVTVTYEADTTQCMAYTRRLVSFLPDNSSLGVIVSECSDNLNKKLGELDFAGDALAAISAIADNNVYYEIGAAFEPAVSTVFTTVGGVKCGVIGTSYSIDEGRISPSVARKITKFVNFCNAFSIPVVTLVDSLGLSTSAESESAYFAPELARLAHAYCNAKVPKITVILGHAVGAAFAILGSKALGADLVYCTDKSEVGALSADSGVAFAWDKHITLKKTREALVAEWRANVSSPAVAAASGEIDDIISINELRARICSALLMLAAKGTVKLNGRKVLPL
ncbi:MAG: hypothetical protein J6V09_03670 [Clostridia bacterium]|nr:hypothetical protein [Clostridia bacterium]